MSWVCERCDDSFYNEHALAQHQRDEDDQDHWNKYECTWCDREFLARAYLNQHMRDSSGHCWECQQCNRKFVSRAARDQHFNNADVHVYPYPCSQCSIRFRTEEYRQEHEDEEHDFECSWCDERFWTEHDRKDHEDKIHDYECSWCYDRFYTPEDRADHEQEEHENRYDCGKCSRRLNSQHALDQHHRDTHCPPPGQSMSTYQFVRRGWGNMKNFMLSYGLPHTTEGYRDANNLAKRMASMAQ